MARYCVFNPGVCCSTGNSYPPGREVTDEGGSGARQSEDPGARAKYSRSVGGYLWDSTGYGMGCEHSEAVGPIMNKFLYPFFKFLIYGMVKCVWLGILDFFILNKKIFFVVTI